MATKRKPAEAFPPGDFLKEELEERGWTQDDLAAVMGRNIRTVNEIVVGKRSITPETAEGLAAALGTSPEFWLNLESAYQLWRVQGDESDLVARRAWLYTIAPIRDMIRRGWVEASDNIDMLENQVMSFFRMASLEETPSFGAHAARKSTPYDTITPAQSAWLFRAMQLSQHVEAANYSRRALNKTITQLKLLMQAPQEARHIPRVLGEGGIRLVVVQHLPETKIDGATFWLDDSPVIALSVRYDRIDNFWFTLMHEIGHIAQGSNSMDTDMDAIGPDSDLPEEERMANTFGAQQSLSQEDLDSLIARVSPLYSTKRIEGFAQVHEVHPGIVVGQLHHRGEVAWANFRRLLVSIRKYVIESALTDGWGVAFPISPGGAASKRR